MCIIIQNELKLTFGWSSQREVVLSDGGGQYQKQCSNRKLPLVKALALGDLPNHAKIDPPLHT